jgi:hypothetical protein
MIGGINEEVVSRGLGYAVVDLGVADLVRVLFE